MQDLELRMVVKIMDFSYSSTLEKNPNFLILGSSCRTKGSALRLARTGLFLFINCLT